MGSDLVPFMINLYFYAMTNSDFEICGILRDFI